MDNYYKELSESIVKTFEKVAKEGNYAEKILAFASEDDYEEVKSILFGVKSLKQVLIKKTYEPSTLFANCCIEYHQTHTFEGLNVKESGDVANACYEEYISTINKIYAICDILPTKINFCQFANISSTEYTTCLNGANTAVLERFNKIEDYITNTLVNAGLRNDINSKVLGQLLQTVGDRGHSQATSSTVATAINRLNNDRSISEEERKRSLKVADTIMIEG